MDKSNTVNFKSADSAIGFFNTQSKKAARPTCVATVLVRFAAFKSIAVRDALIDFVKELFDGLEPFYEGTAHETRMYFYDRHADADGRADALLDKCVLLNTYFQHYFFPNGDVIGFCIFYGIHSDADKLTSLAFPNHYDASEDALDINEAVKLNTKAGKSLRGARRVGKDNSGQAVYEYDVVDRDLARELDRKIR